MQSLVWGSKLNEIDVTVPSDAGTQLTQGKSAAEGSFWRGKARTKNESSRLSEAYRNDNRQRAVILCPVQ